MCGLVSDFGRVGERRKLKGNVGKSKVMRCTSYRNGGRMHVIRNDKLLEEVDCFKNWRAADGVCEKDVENRMNAGYRAWRAQTSVLSNKRLLIKAKKCQYEGAIILTALYGAEAWGMRSAERRKVNVLETKCLRSLVGK